MYKLFVGTLNKLELKIEALQSGIKIINVNIILWLIQYLKTQALCCHTTTM